MCVCVFSWCTISYTRTRTLIKYLVFYELEMFPTVQKRQDIQFDWAKCGEKRQLESKKITRLHLLEYVRCTSISQKMCSHIIAQTGLNKCIWCTHRTCEGDALVITTRNWIFIWLHQKWILLLKNWNFYSFFQYETIFHKSFVSGTNISNRKISIYNCWWVLMCWRYLMVMIWKTKV